MSTSELSNNLWARLKKGLQRTQQTFASGLAKVWGEHPRVDASLWDSLETFLLAADVGAPLAKELLQTLRLKLEKQELKNVASVEQALKQELKNLLLSCEVPLQIDPTIKPFVILVVGVNGAGKTTTIGKLAKKMQSEGKTILLAAGDTFRAAAIEQLKVWGERNQVPVIAQHTGADSASVIFDAFQAAKARQVDVLIADTAGRLSTQETLMEELKKVSRIMRKIDEKAPQEIMLILDAGIGQNALLQVAKFHEALKITSISLTKLDGTAKGGIIFNIAKNFKIPIRFIGIGEGSEDLRTFEAIPFVEALFSKE